LKACFKSLKLCKDCVRGRGFKASLHDGCAKAAAHKRKLHIMAEMQSFALRPKPAKEKSLITDCKLAHCCR